MQGAPVQFFPESDPSIYPANLRLVPNVNFGVVGNDPVANVISSTSLPNISTGDLNNARALYALLTGRISSISGTRNVSDISKNYVQGEALIQGTRAQGFSLYFQDSWRATSNLTLNYGLGWQFQGAAINTNDIYTGPTFEDLWGVSGVNSSNAIALSKNSNKI